MSFAIKSRYDGCGNISSTILSCGISISSIPITIPKCNSAATVYAFPGACYTSAHSLAAVMARDVGKPTVPALTAKERSCASCAGLVDSGLAY